MNKKWAAIPIAAIILVSVAFALSRWAMATTVFTEDFSSGGFSNWSRTRISPGSTQTVNGGVAQFVVPTPAGGAVTYSFLVKDSFASTVNSTITASQDVLVTKVPSGCGQGNGAIFFLYICDSADLGGNYGNIGVGIDGSSVWSLWIGGNQTYSYVFQSAGSAPVSNTWHHVVLVVDNSAGRVALSVDGTVVISGPQRQFTDRPHTISLMSGMGESWWSDCIGPQEIDVDNVRLDISDAVSGGSSTVTVNSPTTKPARSSTPAPTQTVIPTPSVTARPSLPLLTQSPMPTFEVLKEGGFPLWVVVPVIVAVIVGGGVLVMLKKR
ncbi:MAG TPA: LamG-like jellyroll fold domain-containing protein [Candidatus Acidoferrales bacterium]|nr:LamG-like jellyroll fold domain-containing protein [Candidatus Acidoferrales bacterium]